MDCQFLRTVVVHKWKRLRNACKKYLRTMVWTIYRILYENSKLFGCHFWVILVKKKPRRFLSWF